MISAHAASEARCPGFRLSLKENLHSALGLQLVCVWDLQARLYGRFGWLWV